MEFVRWELWCLQVSGGTRAKHSISGISYTLYLSPPFCFAALSSRLCLSSLASWPAAIFVAVCAAVATAAVDAAGLSHRRQKRTSTCLQRILRSRSRQTQQKVEWDENRIVGVPSRAWPSTRSMVTVTAKVREMQQPNWGENPRLSPLVPDLRKIRGIYLYQSQKKSTNWHWKKSWDMLITKQRFIVTLWESEPSIQGGWVGISGVGQPR